MEHIFKGKWISDREFANLLPREVFHRQLEPLELPCNEHRGRHILFRREFTVVDDFEKATVYITADDYYKLYINGNYVAAGPTASYHHRYNYNVIDVSKYLHVGENLIAVHTLYQGLINRVWQSGDLRHGLLLDLELDGDIILSSDESFKTAPHTAYRECGVAGYDTQILEDYDSRAREVGFESSLFDDGYWEAAMPLEHNDHILRKQRSYMPVTENIEPKIIFNDGETVIYDFGSNYVGYLKACAIGPRGERITVRCGQELLSDGKVRHELRANCVYEESLILSGRLDRLDWFDYKAFRYASFKLPKGATVSDVYLCAKHYPFESKAKMRGEFKGSEDFRRIWELCLHTQKYGPQEVIQDCMEREKGFYLGDGCYTALTHMMLTGDDSLVRTLIDDAFASDFISDTLVTCLNCSFMQEIAEYPLILVYLVLWHYRVTADKEYLGQNYPKVVKLLDGYRRDYEKGGLLRDLDKWCVVEWPANFRHGYDVDITEGQVCRGAHISINAYYLEAIRCANACAAELGKPEYRDISPLKDAFFKTFYIKERHLFRDGDGTEHISLVGNVFPFAFGLFPDGDFESEFLRLYGEHGISSLSMFCTFPALMGFVRIGRRDLVKEAIADKGAWLRMLKEDASTTFEGWGKDTKWNTSLFHLTMSYGALFMGDFDLENILK